MLAEDSIFSEEILVSEQEFMVDRAGDVGKRPFRPLVFPKACAQCNDCKKVTLLQRWIGSASSSN
jgi:hypothetical protein